MITIVLVILGPFNVVVVFIDTAPVLFCSVLFCFFSSFLFISVCKNLYCSPSLSLSLSLAPSVLLSLAFPSSPFSDGLSSRSTAVFPRPPFFSQFFCLFFVVVFQPLFPISVSSQTSTPHFYSVLSGPLHLFLLPRFLVCLSALLRILGNFHPDDIAQYQADEFDYLPFQPPPPELTEDAKNIKVSLTSLAWS